MHPAHRVAAPGAPQEAPLVEVLPDVAVERVAEPAGGDAEGARGEGVRVVRLRVDHLAEDAAGGRRLAVGGGAGEEAALEVVDVEGLDVGLHLGLDLVEHLLLPLGEGGDAAALAGRLGAADEAVDRGVDAVGAVHAVPDGGEGVGEALGRALLLQLLPALRGGAAGEGGGGVWRGARGLGGLRGWAKVARPARLASCDGRTVKGRTRASRYFSCPSPQSHVFSYVFLPSESRVTTFSLSSRKPPNTPRRRLIQHPQASTIAKSCAADRRCVARARARWRLLLLHERGLQGLR